MNLWSDGCILCTVMMLLSLLWFCQVIAALPCIKEPFKILSIPHKRGNSLYRRHILAFCFSVKSHYHAPEGFHCKAFYFMFSICNSILKCGYWNRTKQKDISHKDAGLFPLITPSFMQPQIATALFASTLSWRSKLSFCFCFLHHKPSSEVLLSALPLSFPKYCPRPWLSGCVSPKS